MVLILGSVTQGSKISYTILGFTLQPSEFVKILFILFMAAALYWGNDFRRMCSVSVAAAVHVIILVLSRDLGSALIFFMVWLFVLYYATGKWYVLATGVGIGALGAFVSYHLFSHVRVRVQAFLDPWSYIDGIGYQITQSLFAISSGGLWGQGLGKGTPDKIPYVESDFIYAAIAEEFGLIFAVALLAIFLCCFIRFLQLTLGQTDLFCRYLNFGIAIAFIFQTFLTVGGEVRFIPLTGVTLPFISYGGSSMITSIFMFGIAECCVILQEKHRQQHLALLEQERAGHRRRSGQERARDREAESVYAKRQQAARKPSKEMLYSAESSYEERDRRIQKEIRERQRGTLTRQSNRQTRQSDRQIRQKPQGQESSYGYQSHQTDGSENLFSGNYRDEHVRRNSDGYRDSYQEKYQDEFRDRFQDRFQNSYVEEYRDGHESGYEEEFDSGYGVRYGESVKTQPRSTAYERNASQQRESWNRELEDINLQGFQEVMPDPYEGMVDDDVTMDLRFLYQ